MKSDYRIRAKKFLKSIFPYIEGCMWDFDDVCYQVEKYNEDKKRHVIVSCGSARIALIISDYVIKWDYDFENIETIGGCEDEFRVYKRSLSTGYAHLLAPVFRIYHRNRFFFIMPRVDHIGPEEHEYKDINEFITEDEYDWLCDNIGDLHSWNWGLDEFNNPIVIDYACPPNC